MARQRNRELATCTAPGAAPEEGRSIGASAHDPTAYVGYGESNEPPLQSKWPSLRSNPLYGAEKASPVLFHYWDKFV